MVKVFKKIAIYFYGVLELAPVPASQLLIIKARLIKFWPSTTQGFGAMNAPSQKSAQFIRKIAC